MAFPRSMRFIEKESCVPPPTAYQLPSTLDDGHCVTWMKPCSFPNCKLTFLPNRGYDHSTKSNESVHLHTREKESLPATSHICTTSFNPDNKENKPYPQKKDGSNIPRFKKIISKLTEPKAPSFMTRPRHSIHNCFPSNIEENDSYSIFNRNSAKRKSIRISKENREKCSDNGGGPPPKLRVFSNLENMRQLNTSYTIEKESNDSKDNTVIVSEATTNNTGAIPRDKFQNITDDMKDLKLSDTNSSENNIAGTKNESNQNFELFNISLEETNETDRKEHKILDNVVMESRKNETSGTASKNDEPNKILGNLGEQSAESVASGSAYKNQMPSAKLVSETAKEIRIELENAVRVIRESKTKGKNLRSLNVSFDDECHTLVLINEEFMDDDYDSYLKNISLEKLYQMSDNELFWTFNSLINLFMPKQTGHNIKKKNGFVTVKKYKSRKMRKYTPGQIRIRLEKNRNTNSDKNIWSDVQEIVKTAIADLKVEFKREIFQKTENKVDLLLAKLEKVLIKADEDIDSSCERTTVDLIKKLKKIVKQ